MVGVMQIVPPPVVTRLLLVVDNYGVLQLVVDMVVDEPDGRSDADSTTTSSNTVTTRRG
jgi:hypothetical protein